MRTSISEVSVPRARYQMLVRDAGRSMDALEQELGVWRDPDVPEGMRETRHVTLLGTQVQSVLFILKKYLCMVSNACLTFCFTHIS